MNKRNEDERLLSLKLLARNLPGLFEKLSEMRGLIFNKKYRVHSLYAVGGQGILYLCEYLQEPDKTCLLKLVFLEYHTPAKFSIKTIETQRNYIERESELLRLKIAGARFIAIDASFTIRT